MWIERKTAAAAGVDPGVMKEAKDCDALSLISRRVSPVSVLPSFFFTHAPLVQLTRERGAIHRITVHKLLSLLLLFVADLLLLFAAGADDSRRNCLELSGSTYTMLYTHSYLSSSISTPYKHSPTLQKNRDGEPLFAWIREADAESDGDRRQRSRLDVPRGSSGRIQSRLDQVRLESHPGHPHSRHHAQSPCLCTSLWYHHLAAGGEQRPARGRRALHVSNQHGSHEKPGITPPHTTTTTTPSNIYGKRHASMDLRSLDSHQTEHTHIAYTDTDCLKSSISTSKSSVSSDGTSECVFFSRRRVKCNNRSTKAYSSSSKGIWVPVWKITVCIQIRIRADGRIANMFWR